MFNDLSLYSKLCFYPILCTFWFRILIFFTKPFTLAYRIHNFSVAAKALVPQSERTALILLPLSLTFLLGKRSNIFSNSLNFFKQINISFFFSIFTIFDLDFCKLILFHDREFQLILIDSIRPYSVNKLCKLFFFDFIF